MAQGWHQWVDDVVSIDRFGASAPGDEVMVRLGLDVDRICDRVRTTLDG